MSHDIFYQLHTALPDLYQQLLLYVDVLPGDAFSAPHPFTSFVLNINVSTKAHRDGHDLLACLVMPIGDFTEGELVLNEPGLVVPLISGDMMVFPSCDITHFNLDYEGERASLVLHSDKAGIGWMEDRYGRKFHDYLDDAWDWTECR